MRQSKYSGLCPIYIHYIQVLCSSFAQFFAMVLMILLKTRQKISLVCDREIKFVTFYVLNRKIGREKSSCDVFSRVKRVQKPATRL